MAGEEEAEEYRPSDKVGCGLLMLRTGCFMAGLQLIMLGAIIAAALFSLLLFN